MHRPPEITTTARPLSRYMRLVGLLLLVVLLTKIDLRQTLALFSSVKILPLSLAIVANIPQLGLKALRWRLLLKLQGISYPAARAGLAYLSSIYIGILTPGRLGEFVKALYLQQEVGISIGEAMSSVLVDRLFDLYALIAAGSYGLLVFARLVQLPGWILTLVCAGVLASLLMLLPPVGQIALRLVDAVPLLNRYSASLRPQVQGFYVSLAKLLKPRLLVAILLTLASHAIFYTQCYLLALALDIPLEYTFVLFSMALVNLINLLPLTISGLGTREATLSLLFGTMGLGPEIAVAYAALVVLTFYAAAGSMGAAAWSVAPLDPRLVKQFEVNDDSNRQC